MLNVLVYLSCCEHEYAVGEDSIVPYSPQTQASTLFHLVSQLMCSNVSCSGLSRDASLFFSEADFLLEDQDAVWLRQVLGEWMGGITIPPREVGSPPEQKWERGGGVEQAVIVRGPGGSEHSSLGSRVHWTHKVQWVGRKGLGGDRTWMWCRKLPLAGHR